MQYLSIYTLTNWYDFFWGGNSGTFMVQFHCFGTVFEQHWRLLGKFFVTCPSVCVLRQRLCQASWTPNTSFLFFLGRQRETWALLSGCGGVLFLRQQLCYLLSISKSSVWAFLSLIRLTHWAAVGVICFYKVGCFQRFKAELFLRRVTLMFVSTGALLSLPGVLSSWQPNSSCCGFSCGIMPCF